MILVIFAFLMGFACVASIAMFATDGEKFWNWVILFLALAYPYAAAPFIKIPEGFTSAGSARFGDIFMFSLNSALSTHIMFLGSGVVAAIFWVLYQEGTLSYIIARLRGQSTEDWD